MIVSYLKQNTTAIANLGTCAYLTMFNSPIGLFDINMHFLCMKLNYLVVLLHYKFTSRNQFCNSVSHRQLGDISL